jgi:type IV secretory pathway component VirB8
MYPLNRTQIFFLTTQPRVDLEIRLSSLTPDAENLEVYKHAFIKEYIKARNEIIPNAGVMRRKWSAGADGTVYMWSTPEVYEQFTKTGMWTAYMNELPGFDFRCPVEFIGIYPRAENTYAINFRYFCTNSNGQDDTETSTIIVKKDYTIVLKLELENTIKWTDRLQNPLGIRVSQYEIESGDGDPLDFK